MAVVNEAVTAVALPRTMPGVRPRCRTATRRWRSSPTTACCRPAASPARTG